MNRDNGKGNGLGKAAGIGGTEGGRRPTGVPPIPANAAAIDPQVKVQKKRRKLTAAFKQQVVAKVERLRQEDYGAVGAYLREIGVYYSAVKLWERQIQAGTLGGRRGRKQQSREALQREVTRLRSQVQSLEHKLVQSELIIELQKKISDMATLSQSSTCARSR
jgi:transposase-like protein